MSDTQGAGAVAAFRRGGRWRVLVVVALGWFLTLGARYVIPALIPTIKDDFGMSNTVAGAAVSIVWGSYALMQFPAGTLVDKLAERRLLTGSLVATAGSLVVIAASPTLGAFLVGCACFGLSTGLFGPARGTTLSRTFPDVEGAAFGLTLSMGSVGSAVLPFVTGLLVGPLGWQTTALLTVPGFVVVGGATWLVVDDRTPVEDASEGDEGGVRETARALGTAIRRREVVVPAAAAVCFLFSLEGVTAFLPTYLHEVGKLPTGVAAGVYALFFVGGAGGQIVAGSAADRFGDRVVLLSLALVGAVSLAVVPFVSGLLPLAAIVTVLGTRNGISPVSNAYIIAVLPDEVQGTAWGLLRTGFFLLGSTGSIVVGALADLERFDVAFTVLAVVTAGAAVLYYFLPNRRAD